MKITTKPEYEALVPDLTFLEFEELKRSLKEKGQLVPILVNPQGVVLDGHQRLRALLELKMDVKYQIVHPPETTSEVEFVITANLDRRQLRPYQRFELTLKLRKFVIQRAKERQIAALKGTSSLVQKNPTDEKGRSADILAKQAQMSPTQYQHATYIERYGGKELKERLRRGETSITKSYYELLRSKEGDKLRPFVGEIISLPKNARILVGDFRHCHNMIPNESLDLVIPSHTFYSVDVALILDIARFAARSLKETGVLVAQVDVGMLNRSIPLIERESELRFQHPLVAIRSFSGLDRRNDFVGCYHLLLLFGNSLKFSRRLPDLAMHPPGDVETTLIRMIIRALTPEMGRVCDPVFRFGSVFKASLMNRRCFDGFTIEESVANDMRNSGKSLARGLAEGIT